MDWHRFNDQFRESFWERQERQRKARNAARAASAIEARSDETAQQAQPEGQVSGAQSADAQKPDFAMSLNDLPTVSRD